jgi:uncharacterized membrane-anchored protein YitT (DUF2179 family)
MKLVNKFLFVINTILIMISTVIGIYSSKDYSFSILSEIIHNLHSIKEILWL